VSGQLFGGSALPGGVWVMGSDRRGYMGMVLCKDSPWVYYQDKKWAEALAVFCLYLPDCYDKKAELPDMFESLRLLKYDRRFNDGAQLSLL